MKPAYDGNKEYIFISYAHKDNDLVLPFIEELQKTYNVWYDEGIRYGREWEEEILEKLNGCSIFLFCVTNNSLNSENCSDEIYKAREEKKNFINIVFDSKIKLSEKFMFRYGRYQMCFVDKFKSNKDAIADLNSKCEWFNSVKTEDNSSSTSAPEEPKEKTKEINKKVKLDTLQVGDTFEFGAYDAGNGKEPILWRVLSVEDDKLLVVSDQIIDNLQYHAASGEITWENSSLRNWLNTRFLQSSFNKNEQKEILLTNVINTPNVTYNTDCGNDTQDKIFILNEEEVLKYFYDVKRAMAYPTDAAIQAKVYKKKKYCDYWLRNQGKTNKKGAYISPFTSIYNFAYNNLKAGVRPAMFLNRKQDNEVINNLIDEEVTSNINNDDINNNNLNQFSSFVVGDKFEFGAYNAGSGKKPILWQVLSVEDDKLLVVTDQIIDKLKYHAVDTEVTWENSTLRDWLNTTFFNSSFKEEEKEKILLTNVINTPNKKRGTDCGNDTQDKIFILSEDEVIKYFYNFTNAMAYPTDAAIEAKIFKKKKYCDYWLRNKGKNSKRGAFITNYSTVYDAAYVHFESGIRPAMYIKKD